MNAEPDSQFTILSKFYVTTRKQQQTKTDKDYLNRSPFIMNTCQQFFIIFPVIVIENGNGKTVLINNLRSFKFVFYFQYKSKNI